MSELRFTESHEWIRADGAAATVGITTYAAGQLGDVVYVELPAPGKKLAAGAEAAVVESVKAASAKASNIRLVCVKTRIRCRLLRSARTPPNDAKRSTGTCEENATSPSITVEPVSRYTSHDWATVCIHVPTSDTS